MAARTHILILLISLLFSCEKHLADDPWSIGFSADTIFFDTVFTAVGSTTRELVVTNKTRSDRHIQKVYLAGGVASPFRLNIDGEAVPSAGDIFIAGGDSFYIFIDIIIDPNTSVSPVPVLDSIVFETGSGIRSVVLMAWGQNVIILRNTVVKTSTWTPGRPYVVYGNVTVDTAECLTIEGGTRIYFHRNSSLSVAGRICVNGTREAPVIFSSDRTEKAFENVPGQWKGVFISGISNGNNLNYTVIRNSTYGIRLGDPQSAGLNGIPDLKLNGVRIIHTGVSSLASFYGNVEAVNSVFAHSGFNCVFISSGGEYRFYHCTFYNSWEYGVRTTPALFISELPSGIMTPAGRVSLLFFNCSVTGDLKTEIEVQSGSQGVTGEYFFDHCLVKLDTLTSGMWRKEKFPGTIVNKDPKFINPLRLDLRPDTLSPLRNNGSKFLIHYFTDDIRGNSRLTDSLPDIGAFERKPGEARLTE